MNAKSDAAAWGGEPERDLLHDRRRTLIIRTAARIFVQKGYDKASIDDVAEALKVSKPTIYYYLKNKESILVEIVMLAVEQIDEAVGDHPEHTGLMRVDAFMRRYIDAMLDDLGMCMFLNFNQVARTDSVKRVRSAQRQLHERLHQAVLAGVKDGSIATSDPSVVTQMIFGAYHSIPHWYRPNGPLTPDDIHTRMMETLMHGIATNGAAKGPGRRVPKRKATPN
jgi:AcrR family transcriptional regulator